MNIEEKAKRYAQSQFRDINFNFTRSDLAQSFIAGYTQAVTDLSAENEKLKFESQNYADLFRASQEVVNQYKEALREVTNYFSDRMKKEGGLYSYELDIYRKAKQLIIEYDKKSI